MNRFQSRRLPVAPHPGHPAGVAARIAARIAVWPAARIAARRIAVCVGSIGLITAGSPAPAAAQVDPALFGGMPARAIGPAGMSGRIAAIDVWSADPNLIYVGAATGGVWRSTNGGHTWTPVFDEQPLQGIGAVAINQGSPDIVWVGTGEGNPRNSAGVGAGIYRSLDGGESWSFLGLAQTERIHRIVLHPTDPNIAWVAALGPAWSDGEERGVFKTLDGGRSWRKVLYVDRRTGASDLVMDPRNPNKLYAGLWEFRRQPWAFESGGPGSGLYVTHDGGDSWRRYTTDDGLPEGALGRIGLAVAQSDPDRVYALVEAKQRSLIRTTNGGRSWETVNRSDEVNPRPFYYTDIRVDPTNELRLYNLHSRLQVSEDGGRSFETFRNDLHPDFQALWIDPADSRHLVAGTDGGVFITRDRGHNWRLVDNLPVGQFYHVGVDHAIPYNVYGGMQDNGSWRGPSDVWEGGGIRNYHWKEVGFGDGFATLIDPADSNIGYSMSQGGRLRRFNVLTGERKEIRPWAPDTVELRFNWNAAIALDPVQVGTVYYGSQFVHKSPDRGDTWQIISSDLSTNDPEKQRQRHSGGLTRDASGAENHTTVVTIAPSAVEQGLIWAGTDDGNVQITRAGGGTWENVRRHIKGVPGGTWVPHIEASKFLPGEAFAVFDNHRRGDWEPYVYRTRNYGEDWDRIVDEDDVEGFVHVLEQDLLEPNLLFLGTEFGLYVSLDAGDRWMPWRHGIPAVPVRALVVHPRNGDLVVATHGRGIFVLDDIRVLRQLARNPRVRAAELGLVLFEVPTTYLRSAAAVDGYHFAADAMYRGESRPPGALFTYLVPAAAGAEQALIEVMDDSGALVRTLEGPGEPGIQRTNWDLRITGPGERGSESDGRMEALPGWYAVRVSMAGLASEQRFEVVPDPRTQVSTADRLAKAGAVRSALETASELAQIRERVETVAAGLEAVRARMSESGEGLPELDASAERLAAAVEIMLEAVHDAERSGRIVGSLESSRDSPTESQRIRVRRFRDEVNLLVVRLDGVIEGEIGEFRALLAGTDLELFPVVHPVRR